MPLASTAYNGTLIESRLKSASESMLKKNKINITAPGIRKEILKSELPAEVRKKQSRMSRGIIDSDNIISLMSMASFDANMALLVHYVNVKVGSSGSWDPNFGAITSDNSRSIFYSALINCATGKLLWKNKVLLRSLPQKSNDRLSESLDLLFLNFPVKEEHK